MKVVFYKICKESVLLRHVKIYIKVNSEKENFQTVIFAKKLKIIRCKKWLISYTVYKIVDSLYIYELANL